MTDTASVGFTLVRNQAKAEAPLKALGQNGLLITTIAKVTFYGHDQTGREVSVSGNIEVDLRQLRRSVVERRLDPDA